MIIGFDASRAQLSERAGPENYTYNLLRELLRVDERNFYRLYYNPQASPPRLAGLGEAGSLQLRTSNSRPTRLRPPANDWHCRAGRLEGGRVELRTISWPKLWTQAGLALECLRNPPDVLFIPAHTIPLIRRPGLKTVVTIHDVGFQEYLETYQRRWGRLYEGRVSNYAARNATHLIAVSESTKRDLIGKLGISSDKITVVHEGVDHEIFRQQFNHLAIEQLKRKYGVSGEYLLFVGTIQPRKNLVRLIEAFRKTLKSRNPPVSTLSRGARRGGQISLVIAGKKGWLADEIYQAPKKFGVGDRVKFLGYVPTDDIVSLMNGALAFVFPSLYEGFGLVVLEAMACGCPVVTSNISSLPEVVGDGGILVDPYSVEDIGRGIKRVLEFGEEQRRDLVEKGLKRAQKFTWRKTAQKTIEIYDRRLSINSQSL